MLTHVDTSYTWTQGRKIASIVKNGVSSRYLYYYTGMSISKTGKVWELKMYIPGGYFPKKRNGYTYEVTYWNEGKGILRYTYVKQKTPERELAETAAVIVLGGFALFYSAATGIPVYI